ncbi:MAG: efflux RND transporter periplasmic adaptor subunit [Candidatus Hydrogenedentes bacterium]|nr:efflux RND transporter periplasmic adaptor subunit [Candidatus Hydrogenedentota bacterium]
MFKQSEFEISRTERSVSLRVTLAALLLAASVGCSMKSAISGEGPAAAPVRAGLVAQKTIPIQIPGIGTVEAYSTVSVKAQVAGELAQVHFQEGQYVKKGDLLFTIDPRPFEVAFKQAEANLAKDQAQLQNARVETKRAELLTKEGIGEAQQYDLRRTNQQVLQAAIAADEAAIEHAKLQLEYCSIRAPMDGRAGKLVVHPGNLVKANDDPALVAINQITPIYAAFSVPEGHLAAIQQRLQEGEIPVAARLPDVSDEPLQGKLAFVDNAVDKATGTILLKATFANDDRRLWPGQFVNVTLTLGTRENAMVVPAAAVQPGQQGPYVYVVKPDHTVEARAVAVAEEINGDRVVETGLALGEQVVIEGHLRLSPGAKVNVLSEAESKPAA